MSSGQTPWQSEFPADAQSVPSPENDGKSGLVGSGSKTVGTLSFPTYIDNSHGNTVTPMYPTPPSTAPGLEETKLVEEIPHTSNIRNSLNPDFFTKLRVNENSYSPETKAMLKENIESAINFVIKLNPSITFEEAEKDWFEQYHAARNKKNLL